MCVSPFAKNCDFHQARNAGRATALELLLPSLLLLDPLLLLERLLLQGLHVVRGDNPNRFWFLWATRGFGGGVGGKGGSGGGG